MSKKYSFEELVLYGGVSKDDYAAVKNTIRDENYKVWRVVSVVIAILAMLMLICTYVFPNYFASEPGLEVANASTKYGICYSALAIYGIILAFLLNVLGSKYPKIISPLIDITTVTLLVFFAITSTSLDKGNVSVIYLALIMALSLVTVRNPLTTSIIIFASQTFFIIVACIYEYPVFINAATQTTAVFDDEIVYSNVFATLALFLGSFINHVRIKDFALRKLVEEQRDYDPLTKAKSKIAYDREIGYIMERLFQNSTCEPFAVVVFDVNGLKITNDTYGHEFGDQLLQRAAALIQESFSNSNVYRIGGDEFAVIVKDTDYKNRNEIVRKFRAKVNSAHQNSESLLTDIPVACGMATYDPENDMDYLSIFSRADTIMYDDKRSIKLRNKHLQQKRENEDD